MAQDHRWQAPLEAVPIPGMYAVVLGPELMGRSRSDLGDLRLMDPDGNEVPYVLRVSSAPEIMTRFIPFTLLRNEVQPYRTLIEIERAAEEPVGELHIRVRPADVRKHARVTGSDDGVNWYMVRDEHLVAQGAHGDPPQQVLMVDLPRTDYRYYRIALNDSLTPPMQVLDVGRYVHGQQLPVRHTTSGTLKWVQEDSAGTTRLHIWSLHPLAVDRLSFAVKDEVPFRRSGMIVLWQNERVGRTSIVRNSRVERIQGSFVIASDKPHVIDVPGFRADTFMLVIDNGDDRPLNFERVEASVREHVLLAQLGSGKEYDLVTGDPSLHKPQYDMVHFMDRLPEPIDTIHHPAPKAMGHLSQARPTFDPEEWWVWAIIIPLSAGMAYMAVRMLRQGQGTS